MSGCKIWPADRWFSKAVRARVDWTCERCSTNHRHNPGALDCSHYMGRGNWATRFDPDNAFALCYGCHAYVTANPSEHKVFVRNALGDAMQEEIERKAKQQKRGLKKLVKQRNNPVVQHYKAEFERIEKLRAQGDTRQRIEVIGYE